MPRPYLAHASNRKEVPAMCPHCDDLTRTIRLLEDLSAYADLPGADLDFADTLGFSLAASVDFGQEG
jgi:hypothetical protein